MLEGASHFVDSELDDLRGVIRLTVEFFHRLQRVDIDSIDDESLQYWGGQYFLALIHLLVYVRLTEQQRGKREVNSPSA